MHLAVNSTFSKCDSKGSIVTPSLIPRIVHDPMILTPTYNLYGMSTESFTTGMSVNTTLVSHKIFINCKSSSNGSIGQNVLLDLINACQAIRGASVLLVLGIISWILAFLITCWVYLFDLCAGYILGAFYMVCTERHGVGETGILVFKITTSYYTGWFEPCPRSSNLTSIAAHRLAF